MLIRISDVTKGHMSALTTQKHNGLLPNGRAIQWIDIVLKLHQAGIRNVQTHIKFLVIELRQL